MIEIDGLKIRKNLLFVNKKKQKNFVNFVFFLTPADELCIKIPLNKSFCFFFQKEDFLLRRIQSDT